MKKFFKKPLLLVGSMAAVIGLSFLSSQEADVKAQTDPKWCQYADVGPCEDPMVDKNCVCDDQC